jgi:two-component system, NtrC family, sensor histidine kinase KinB
MIIEQSQSARVLLIDDNEDNLALLRELLERENYAVSCATDALAGLETARQLRPDLILSDIMMPGLNGFQLTQRIKGDPNLAFIPVILITARNEVNDKMRAIEAGADDFLAKPIQRLELLARAKSLVRLKKSTDALMQAAEENARLYVEAEARASELSVLNEAALAVGSQLTLNELLNLTAKRACELVRAQSATIYLSSEESGTLTVKAEYNTPRSFLGRTLAYGEGVSGLVVLTGKPMRINNYSQWSGRANAYSTDDDITAVLAVPMINGGKVVGILVVMDDHQRRQFTDDDVRLLNLLAPQAAIAVSNALLYEEVRRERDRISTVLNSVKDGILMLDRNYSVVVTNERFTDLMKLESEQVLNQTITTVADLLGESLESDPPFSAEMIMSILNGLRRNPNNVYNKKLAVDDPKRRWVDWSIWPVPDQANGISGWLNVFHDITQERELEQLREDFISMLVHDLRGPLTSIIGGIELVATLMPDEQTPVMEQQSEFLEQVNRNCYSLLEMINTLLEVSRLEAGRLPLHMRPQPVEKLIDDSVQQVMLAAQEKQIQIFAELPDGEINPRLDNEKMRRVLVNLLSNAVTHSPRGSDINITVEIEEGIRRKMTTSNLDPTALRRFTTAFLREQRKDNEPPTRSLLLSISDKGPGVKPEMQERIFDKFVTGSTTMGGRNKSGTGLGLAFCKLVVEGHGGRIWVESEAGHGSTFRISLPGLLD